jgi:hypothetical protein
MENKLGMAFYGVFGVDPFSLLPTPPHIFIIWDIISAQLKGAPDFLASIIFRIMSPRGMPAQHLGNPFSDIFCSSDIFFLLFWGLPAPCRICFSIS